MNIIHSSDPLTSRSGSQLAFGNAQCSQLKSLLESRNKSSPLSITPPQSEWSSLITSIPETNPKKILYAEGLFNRGSGEICGNYIAQSDSDVLHHPYYNFPKVPDPGIRNALYKPEPKQSYSEDGQELYIACCQEMDHAPVRIFQNNILTPEINLKYYGIRKNHFRAMAKALIRNRIVRHLNLTENFLTIDDCFHIGQVLCYNTTLIELIMAGCRIGPYGFFRMKSGLGASRKLIKIDLSRNHLGDEGGVLFAQHIVEGGSTPDINLSNNELGTGTASRLARAFMVRHEITNLDLSWNKFYAQEPVAKMITSLATSKVLIEVNLAWNGLTGAVVAKAIGELFLCPSLERLNLSNNKLSGEDILTPITTKLPNSKNLELLNLSSNPITQLEAASILKTMLNPDVTIRTLLLDDIRVSDKFFECLEMIKTMKSRKGFTVTYGDVDVKKLPSQVDSRKVIVLRADFLCRSSIKHKIDFALYMFRIAKEFHMQINSKDFSNRVASDRLPLDEDLLNGLIEAFPAASKTEAKDSNKKENQRALDLKALVEYVHRMWPQKRLPPLTPRRSIAGHRKKKGKKVLPKELGSK